MKPILTVLAALALAACANNPQIVSGTPESVSYTFQGDQVPQANEQASKYCSTFGKAARLQQVVSNGGKVVASYDCG